MTYSLGMNGAQLREIRQRLALTQQEFAKQIGVTPNSVARWERDEMKMTEPVARLVKLLGRSTSTPTRKGRH